MQKVGKVTIGAQEVQIPAGAARLNGNLDLPAGASGLVLFAHGSGSSRLSPRNVYVAQHLRAEGLGTLLFDLLTEAEAADRANVFNIDLLTQRLLLAGDWLRAQELPGPLRFGYFGASTGAAAALQAAALRPGEVGAIVSRGGRPDLAERYLERVTAPTLLIVGGSDPLVLQLNEAAYALLQTEKELVVVPGATHLFEEPGALEDVADRAGLWFRRYLAPDTSGNPTA
ncbi:MAG: dienelactone hydrolase family protein [Anaerolineae bacterium]